MKEKEVKLLLANAVAEVAARFCEELQEDAPGVPQKELAKLHDALDAWEGKIVNLPGSPYDDSVPVLAALAALAEDGYATDHQRRVAHLALITIVHNAGKLPCGHTVADLVAGRSTVTFCGECSRLRGIYS